MSHGYVIFCGVTDVAPIDQAAEAYLEFVSKNRHIINNPRMRRRGLIVCFVLGSGRACVPLIINNTRKDAQGATLQNTPLAVPGRDTFPGKERRHLA